MNASSPSLRVALFITCLADWMRPRIVESTLKVLSAFGCAVDIPSAQTCCGQPNHNSGDRAGALALARHTVNALAGYDYVVLPSGSCTGMITKHYPALFALDATMLARLQALKVYELTQFLVQVLQVDRDESRSAGLATLAARGTRPRTLTYHDSCSGLRELGIKREPRLLIAKLQQHNQGKLLPMADEENCCGFGGAFSAKFGEISSAIAARKCDSITDSGAEAVVLGDLGCMLNIEGKFRAQGKSTRVFHIAQYLAGDCD